MKKFIAAHYEKLLLCVGAALPGAFFLLSSSGEPEDSGGGSAPGGGSELALNSEKDKTLTLDTLTPHGLMPGDEVTLSGAEPDSFNRSFQVVAIRMPEPYDPIEVMLKDGSLLTGELRKVEQRELTKDWAKSTHGMEISVAGQEDPAKVPFSEVKHLRGSKSVVLEAPDASRGDSAYGEIELVVYRERALASPKKGRGRIEWINETNATSRSEDEPPYDLFTPPVLYVIEGVITPTLPEKPKAVKPPEPFGLRLAAFEQVPYRFTIRGWAGDTPYLTDGNRSHAPGRPVTNRLNLRVPYKDDPAWKPGKPSSLAPTNMDDPDKLIMVEHFQVQDFRDPKTGGIRPVGRVMIKDFTLNKSFEINTFMAQTFAGQYRIRVESDQAGHAGAFEFDLQSAGKDFRLNDREYRILEIDLEGARVHLQKQALDPRELQVRWLSAPASPGPENP